MLFSDTHMTEAVVKSFVLIEKQHFVILSIFVICHRVRPRLRLVINRTSQYKNRSSQTIMRNIILYVLHTIKALNNSCLLIIVA